MFKLVVEKPQIPIAEEIKGLLKKGGRPKKEHKPWTKKERFLVGLLLALTILGSLYFWYRGQGKLPTAPSFRLPSFGFGETIILEK